MSSDSQQNVPASLSSVSEEWQKLLTHFDWGVGFSFVVILVPNPQDAEIRRQALERTLAAENKTITRLYFSSPDELKQLAGTLLDLQPAADAGAIWVSAVISAADKDFPAWQSAWREAVARLNQFRNHLQQRFSLTLLFVGAPWLAETIRTYAPDLWSVRTLVIDIEPDASPLRDLQAAHQRHEPVTQSFSDSAPNVELALKAAAKLRGKTGKESELVLYLIRAGEGLYNISQYAKAEEILTEAIQIQRKLITDFEQMAEALFYLGVVQTMLSDPKAAQHLQEALPLFQQIGDIQGVANCILGLGTIAFRNLEFAEAGTQYEKALPLYRQLGDVQGEANCVRRLGDIELSQSKHKAARVRFEEALPLYRRTGDVQGEANCILRLGDITLAQSQYEEARLKYEQALPLFEKVEDIQGEATCVWSLGTIALAQSRFEEGKLLFERALDLNRRIGGIQGEANCIASLGEIAVRQLEYEKARVRFEEALPRFQMMGDVQGEANCILSLGKIALGQLQYEEAQKHYEEALTLYRQAGDMHGEANCIRGLGDIALRRGEYKEAQAYFQKALPLYRQRRDVQGEANSILRLGDIMMVESQYENAKTNFEAALTLYQRIPEPHSIGLAQVRLARLALEETERDTRVKAARLAWTQIDRPDLVVQLDEEFG